MPHWINRNRRESCDTDGRPKERKKPPLICFAIAVILAITAGYLYFTFFGGKVSEGPPEEIHFWGDAHWPDPDPRLGARIVLTGAPKIGQYLHIFGNVTKDAESFCVTLQKGFEDLQNVACNVCVYFGADPRIEYDISHNGLLFLNNRAINPFAPGEQFDLRVRFLAENVQIFAQRGEIGIFSKDYKVHEAKHLKIIGNVTNLRLMQVDGANYTTPYYRRIDFGSRLDIALKPTAETEPALWESLIEGKPMKASRNRLRRKGGRGGGRGERAAHGAAAHGDGFSGRIGRGSSKGIFKAYGRSSYDDSSPAPGTSYGQSSMGFYSYSPRHGGYYHSQPSPWGSHAYVPASYSYRNSRNGSIVYADSEGHGRYYDPNYIMDNEKIPKPRLINVILYRSNGHNATNREEWSPTFKLSFRFDLNATTLSRFDGGWVDEGKADFVPIDDWRLFDLVIRAASHKMYIYNNNYELASYKLSSEIEASDYIGIEGDVEILSFKENGVLA